MSNRSNNEILEDIREASRRIEIYTAEMTYGTFQNDIKTQDAVIRNLEVIGEATKNLSSELRNRYPNVPWKSMAGVRDRLIHHYSGVDLEIVWNIVVVELPDVALQIADIILGESE